MFRALALLLFLLASPAFAQSGGAVKQSGVITRDHATKWVNDGVIGDAGGFPIPLCAPLPTNFSAAFATISTNNLGCATITQGGTGPGSGNVLTNVTLTNNALLIGQGTNVVGVLGSLGTATTVLHGNASGPPSFGPVTSVDMAPGAALGNISPGSITSTYLAGGAALANIGPGGVAATYLASGAALANIGAGNITNTYLANPSININSVTCTLGGSCTVSGGGGDTITSPNSTLTVGGTPSNTTLDLNLSHANTWLAAQQIPNLVVTGSLTAIGLVTNTDLAAGAALANIGLGGVTNTYIATPSITVNGTTCTLGSSCAPSGAGVSVTSSTPNTIVVTPTPGTTTFTIGTIQTTIDCTAGTITGNCTGGAALIAGYSGANVELGAHAYTLAQAGTTGFGAGWGMCFINTGTSGNATVTTTTSVFLGSATNTSSLTLEPGGWACPQSDSVNYVANMGHATAGGGGGSGTVSSGTGPAIAQYDVGTGTTVVASTISKDATLAQGGALTLASSNGTRADLGLNVNGALKVTTAGAVSQAGCDDLSNGVASCKIDTTNAANISSGTLAAARMLPLTTGQVYVGNGSNQPASTPFATPAAAYLTSLSAGAPIKLVGIDGGNNVVTQTPFVTDVALTPGLTTAIGTCNSSLQHITSTGQINQQDCYRTVTTSTAGASSDSGWTVKMNCNGCVYTAIAPTGSGGNQGVFFDLIGDGNASHTYVVANATAANFLGCPLGGGTTMTVPGNVNVRIVSNPDNNATNYYQCVQGNGTVTVTNNYSGVDTIISAQTATLGTTTTLTWTALPSSYRALKLVCNNVTLSSSGVNLAIHVGEGAGPTWETSANYVRLRQTTALVGGVTSGGNDTDTALMASDIFITNLVSTVPAMFQFEMNNPGVTGVSKIYAGTIDLVSNADGTYPYQYKLSGYWGGDTNAITGYRLLVSGGGTFGANCTLIGEN